MTFILLILVAIAAEIPFCSSMLMLRAWLRTYSFDLLQLFAAIIKIFQNDSFK